MSEPLPASELVDQGVSSLVGCGARLTSWMDAGCTYPAALTRLAALDKRACVAWLQCERIYILRGSLSGPHSEAPLRVQRYLLERRG